VRSAFSTDGTVMALLVADRTVRVLDARTGTARMVLALHPDRDLVHLTNEFRVVLSPDGSRLLLRPHDAIQADHLKNTPLPVDTRHPGFDTGAFSPDGSRVALVQSGVSVVDTGSAEEICRTGSLLVNSSIAYSADGKTLAGTDEAGLIKLWSAATAQELIALEIPVGEVLLVKFSSDGKRLAAVVQRKDDQAYELYIWTTEAQ
jgi:WD40 repeat protein